LNASDLLARGFALMPIQLRGCRTGQSPLRSVHNRGHYLQIAQQFGPGLGEGFLLHLPLRFEKQLGVIQDAFTDRG